MKLIQRGTHYHIEYQHRGQRCRESLHTTDPATAERLLADRIRALSEAAHAPGQGRYRLDALLDSWLDRKRRDGQRLTSIESRLKRTRKHLGRCRVADLTTDELERWQGELLALGLAPATVNLHISDVRGALTDAAKRGKISRASLPFFPTLREDNEDAGRYVDPATFSRILAHLPLRLRSFCEFAYISGRRRGEVAALAWSGVSDDCSRLTWRTTKNRKGLVLPLVGRLREIVEERRALALHDGRLVPQVFHIDGRPFAAGTGRRPWGRATTAVGLPGLRFHDLRHSALTNLVEAGASQEEAMAVSGHADPAVFQRYSHLRQARKIETLERLFRHLDARDAGAIDRSATSM